MYRSQGVLDSVGLRSFEDRDKLFGQLMPLKIGSITSPQNIADAATFLASDLFCSLFLALFFGFGSILFFSQYLDLNKRS